MTPAARLRAAAEMLDRLADPSAGLDATLDAWARANRYAGSGDRRAIADRVHDCLRRRSGFAAQAGADAGRALVLASLVAEGLAAEAIAALHSGGHAPDPLSAAETARLAAWPEPPPPPEGVDFPAALWPELLRSSAEPEAEARALTRRAALDLRVDPRRASPAQAAARLAAEGVATAPAPLSPLGLRAEPGARLGRLGAYLEGWVEPQDAASQAAALLTAALAAEAPEGPLVDLCAGAGGKTLALAAALENAGRRIVASDLAPERMADLDARLERADARGVERLAHGALGRLEGRAALVLVDAPCSGSGAWARHPLAKWRTTPARLEALGRAQARALDDGLRLLAPGGLLVYVTCSLFRAENEDRVAALRAERPDLGPAPLTAAWTRAGLLGPTPRPGVASLRLSPAEHGAEGFFVAAFRRGPPPASADRSASADWRGR